MKTEEGNGKPRSAAASPMPGTCDIALTSHLSRAAFNDCLDRFDEAWQTGQSPSIARFLPSTSVACDRGCSRGELLIELVMIDIECRWKREFSPVEDTDSLGARPRLEDYVRCFPDLGVIDDLPLKLIKYEYEVRCRAGDAPTHQDYFSRFSKHAAALSAALSRTDGAPTHSGAIVCPRCRASIDRTDQQSATELSCPSCGESVSAPYGESPIWRPSAGSMIGHFKLQKKLGEGAFGVVYRATDTVLNRNVAVKIPKHTVLDEEERKKVIHDGRAAAQLQHSNIVAIHDVLFEEGLAIIVSDYVEGQTLERTIKARASLPKSRSEFGAIAKLVSDLATALNHAHQNKVFHRDVKPSNILIDTKGKPYIIDFGLAKHADAETITTDETKFLGTVAYMPPEQARSEAHLADARSDVYSLGVVLFELLTGSCPFRGTFQMVVQQLLEVDAPPPRSLNQQVPRDLQTICLKCLEKAPGRRYQSAQSFADDLSRFLTGEPIRARQTTAVERALKWCRRRPAAAALILMSSLSLVSVSIGALLYADKVDRNAKEEQALQEKVARVLDEAGELFKVGKYDRVIELLHDFASADTENGASVAQKEKASILLADAKRELTDSKNRDISKDAFRVLQERVADARAKFARIAIPLLVTRGTLEIPVDPILLPSEGVNNQVGRAETIRISLSDVGYDGALARSIEEESINAANLAMEAAEVSSEGPAGETTIPLSKSPWLTQVERSRADELEFEARTIRDLSDKTHDQLARSRSSIASEAEYSGAVHRALRGQYEAIRHLLKDSTRTVAAHPNLETAIDQLKGAAGDQRYPWIPFFLAVAYGANDDEKPALAYLSVFEAQFKDGQAIPFKLADWIDLVRGKLLTQQFVRQLKNARDAESRRRAETTYEVAEAGFNNLAAESKVQGDDAASLRYLSLLNRAALRVASGQSKDSEHARQEYEKAHKDILAAIEIEAATEEITTDSTSARLFLALVLHLQGKYLDALPEYGFVIENADESGKALALRGQAEAYVALDRFPDALGVYERLVTLPKQHGISDQLRLATLYAKNNQRDSSLKVVRQVLRESGENTTAHRLQAILLGIRNSRADQIAAVETLNKIIESGVQTRMDYFLRATLQMRLRSPAGDSQSEKPSDKEIQDWISAAPAQPTNLEHLQILMLRADVYSSIGLRQRAQADFKTVSQALQSKWAAKLVEEGKLTPEMLRRFYLGRSWTSIPERPSSDFAQISLRDKAAGELARTDAEQDVARAVQMMQPDVETLLFAARCYARLTDSLQARRENIGLRKRFNSAGARHLAQAIGLLQQPQQEKNYVLSKWDEIKDTNAYNALRQQPLYRSHVMPWLETFPLLDPDFTQEIDPGFSIRPKSVRPSVPPPPFVSTEPQR